jgi:ATP-dependent DNA helicase RecG
LEIIRRGETEEVEFKEDLTNRDDVLKTVVALANTNGGVLLIGVNDECQVVSFKESADVIEQKIRNWVRDGCEQPIQMEFQMRKVLNQDVMVIVVELSQDRPCWLREKGPFIRYGSNNRLASRAEVERMKDKPGLGSAVTYA